jgi:putative ABC transport system permease protein
MGVYPAVMENLLRDIRHTLRGLIKTPVFALSVVFTLALGIGGNTALFSVVDQLLLRPLPYPDGDRLVTVYEKWLTGGGSGLPDASRGSVSPANWLDWQRDSRTIERFAAWRATPLTMTGVGDPVQLSTQVVSAEFFPVLGVAPLLGRTISEADDKPNAPLVAVLSHRLWQQRFGGDPGVIGRIIQLNERPVEVVGVMPASFRFLYPENDLWGAFRLNRDQPWRETAGRFMSVVARVKPGVTVAGARTEMEGIAGRLEETYEFNKHTSVTLVPMREELTGQVQTSLWVLYGAVGLLLAIASFNVANLLLARAASRGREMAIRTSLGAARLALIGQLVIESVMLAVAGGVLGLALARWSLDALLAFAPAGLLRVEELSVDARVLGYALLLSLTTGLVVGLVPALMVLRGSIASWMRATGASVTQAPRVRQALVVGQVALTVVLLCGAGLLARTLVALNATNAGIDKPNILTMEVQVPAARYNPARRTAFFRQALEELRALPGVERTGAANSLAVIGEARGGSWFHRLGTPELPESERPSTTIRVVTPGYFRAIGVPVLRGREFTDLDDGKKPAFIVNDSFARAFLGGVDPLSASLTVWMQNENPYAQIVGVVGDVSEGSVKGDPEPTVYYSHAMMPETKMTLVIRAAEPDAITSAAIQTLRRLDANLAVSKVQTVEHAMAESLAQERLSALVSVAFAVVGLLLAALGLYGLLAYLVSQRTKEIGVRLALGASAAELTRSVVASGYRLVVSGAVLGVAIALAAFRLLSAMLFGVSPYDALTYAGVVLVLAIIAGIASYVPARAVTRVEPLLALRQE